MITTEITLDDIKNHGWYEVALDLDFTEDEATKIFQYGEYGSITIEIDKNLNIVGGKVNRYKL